MTIDDNAHEGELDCLERVRFKMTSERFHRIEDHSSRYKQKLYKVHMDLGIGIGGGEAKEQNMLVIYDGCTKYLWAYAVTTKSDATAHVLQWIAQVEKETHAKVHKIVTDQGGEFKNHVVMDTIRQTGTHILYTATDTPHQNAMAERQMRTIKEALEATLHSARLSRKYWPQALAYEIYCANRAAHKDTEGKAPFDLLYGVRPNVGSLWVFVCIGLFYVTKKNRKPFEGKARWGIYLGKHPEQRAFQYLPLTPTGLQQQTTSTAPYFLECWNHARWIRGGPRNGRGCAG